MNLSTERLDTALCACQQKINVMKAQLAEYFTDQTDHVEECRQSIESFLKEKLVKDVPTGNHSLINLLDFIYFSYSHRVVLVFSFAFKPNRLGVTGHTTR